MLSALATTYYSMNSAITKEDATHYPAEFLNSVDIASLLPYVLTIKCGMPVMVLHSPIPPKLMNGTRCIVTKTKPVGRENKKILDFTQQTSTL